MKLFQKETDEAEKLLRLFYSDLRRKGFDLKIFNKKKIKQHFGKGLYDIWKEYLEKLGCRKIIIIFDEKEARVSWPSAFYLDRLIINIALSPDREALSNAEKELISLLEVNEESS